MFDNVPANLTANLSYIKVHPDQGLATDVEEFKHSPNTVKDQLCCVCDGHVLII